MSTVTKLTPNGTFYITGTLDEATYNPNSGYSKNLYAYSQDFQTWLNISGTPYACSYYAANSAIAPDGTMTAWTISNIPNQNSSFSNPWSGNISINFGSYGPSNSTYTKSIYAKWVTGSPNLYFQLIPVVGSYINALFNLQTGVATGYAGSTAGMIYVGNGWWRCWQTFNSGPTNQNGTGWAGDSFFVGGYGSTNLNTTMQFWGTQMELGNLSIYERTGAPSNKPTFNAGVPLPIVQFANRTDANGNYFIAGTLDEATYNASSGYRKNQVTNTIGNPFSVTAGGGTIISTNELAPDGTYTAIRFRPIQQYSGVRTNACWLPNVIQTGSVWCRVDSGTQAMQLGLNGGGLSVNFTANSTWQRFNTGPFTKTANYTDFFSIFNYNTSNFIDFIVWGPQVELGSVVTTYEATDINGNPVANFNKRIESTGNDYVIQNYDEVTYNPNSGYIQNMLSFSTQLNLANAWSVGGVGSQVSILPTVGTVSPDGTYNAFKYVPNLYSNPQYFDLAQGQSYWSTKAVPQTIGQPYTFSIYAKAAEWNWLGLQFYDNGSFGAEFNLVTGVINNIPSGITASITNVGNGWWRCSITRYQASSNFNAVYIYPNYLAGGLYYGDGNSGAYIWGPQLEMGTKPTTYVATGINGIPLLQ